MGGRVISSFRNVLRILIILEILKARIDAACQPIIGQYT
jgi:hypothetical protein